MKKVLYAFLIFAMVLTLAVACKNGASGGSDTPKYTPSLKLVENSFSKTYMLNDPASALKGVLIYSDDTGKATTVNITASGVTTDFNSSTTGDKVLTITYKNLSVAVEYSIVKLEKKMVFGTFVIGTDMTMEIDTTNEAVDTVTIKKYDNFYKFLKGEPSSTTTPKYRWAVTALGKTVIRVDSDEIWGTYTPDDEAGLEGYPRDYNLDEPAKDVWFVSTTKEENRMIVHTAAKNNYLWLKVTDDYTYASAAGYKIDFYFKDVNDDVPTAAPNFTIDSSQLHFDKNGVFCTNGTYSESFKEITFRDSLNGEPYSEIKVYSSAGGGKSFGYSKVRPYVAP